MNVKYINKTAPLDLTNGNIYSVLSIEKGWYRVIDDTGEDYLYPPDVFQVVDDSDGQMKDLKLSKAERDRLRDDLKRAEPYDDDDPVLYTFDGAGPDFDRWRATMTRKFLAWDEQQKRAGGRASEPEATPESER